MNCRNQVGALRSNIERDVKPETIVQSELRGQSRLIVVMIKARLALSQSLDAPVVDIQFRSLKAFVVDSLVEPAVAGVVLSRRPVPYLTTLAHGIQETSTRGRWRTLSLKETGCLG